MGDFQHITHHETDYSRTGGEKKRRKPRREQEGGGGCEKSSLAGCSDTVPGSGDVSEGPYPPLSSLSQPTPLFLLPPPDISGESRAAARLAVSAATLAAR